MCMWEGSQLHLSCSSHLKFKLHLSCSSHLKFKLTEAAQTSELPREGFNVFSNNIKKEKEVPIGVIV